MLVKRLNRVFCRTNSKSGVNSACTPFFIRMTPVAEIVKYSESSFSLEATTKSYGRKCTPVSALFQDKWTINIHTVLDKPSQHRSNPQWSCDLIGTLLYITRNKRQHLVQRLALSSQMCTDSKALTHLLTSLHTSSYQFLLQQVHT